MIEHEKIDVYVDVQRRQRRRWRRKKKSDELCYTRFPDD